jgi:Raf kinase inhibitor-like YbhB/YbcL family protein
MRTKSVQQYLTLAFLLAAAISPAAAQQPAPPAAAPAAPAAPAGPPFLLTTPAYADGAEIPTKFTCAAKENMTSPLLQWTNPPKDTASFALLLHDPEAHPGKGMFDVTHWILWNVPGTATQLPEGVKPNPQLPDGTQQGKNIRGANGYQGPCAPPGKFHHYTYELYALDQKLTLDSGAATRADLLKAMDGHILGVGVYVGLFHQ